MQQFNLCIFLKQRQADQAFQTAMSKERFKYQTFLVAVAIPGIPIFAWLTNKPRMFFSFIPMSVNYSLQYDLYYGDMMVRGRHNAEKMIDEEPERFFMPINNGMMSQACYNTFVGLPENYRSKVDKV